MRKLTKQISFELFSWWIIHTEVDGLLSKLKKIFNSFRVVPAHQLSSCDVGGGPGVRGLRQRTGALFTPRPKMTNSINSRNLSRAPMDPNAPDKRLKGFFLGALTSDFDVQYQYLVHHIITFHLTSMLWCHGKGIRICVAGGGTGGEAGMLWRGNRISEMTLAESVPDSVCAWAPEQTSLAKVTNRNSDGEKGPQSAYLILKLFLKTQERWSVSILLYITRKHVIRCKMEIDIKLNLPSGAMRMTLAHKFLWDNKRKKKKIAVVFC